MRFALFAGAISPWPSVSLSISALHRDIRFHRDAAMIVVIVRGVGFSLTELHFKSSVHSIPFSNADN